jgi:hypothetical protein
VGGTSTPFREFRELLPRSPRRHALRSGGQRGREHGAHDPLGERLSVKSPRRGLIHLAGRFYVASWRRSVVAFTPAHHLGGGGRLFARLYSRDL